MVEKSTNGNGPCDYKFEQIHINRQVYIVPVLDNKNIGKVIENSTPALP